MATKKAPGGANRRRVKKQIEFEGMELSINELLQMRAEESQRHKGLKQAEDKLKFERKASQKRIEQMDDALDRTVELPEVTINLGQLGKFTGGETDG